MVRVGGVGSRLGGSTTDSRRRCREHRILREDRALEVPQTLGGLDPQIIDQLPARVLVGLQRVRLPVAPIQSKHEVRTEPLAIGVLADQRLELHNHVGMAAERELRLDQLLERRDPQVVETGDLAPGERLADEVAERRAAPQRERALERRDGALRPARGDVAGPDLRLRTSWTSRWRAARHAGARGLGDEPLEPCRIDRLAIEPQFIAATVGHDLRAGLLGKQLAELRYVELHHLGRARGRLLAPQTARSADRPRR